MHKRINKLLVVQKKRARKRPIFQRMGVEEKQKITRAAERSDTVKKTREKLRVMAIGEETATTTKVSAQHPPKRIDCKTLTTMFYWA